jgi:hypothetical protein
MHSTRFKSALAVVTLTPVRADLQSVRISLSFVTTYADEIIPPLVQGSDTFGAVQPVRAQLYVPPGLS